MSTDWRTAAIDQKARADRLDQREDDLEHALNLLINDVVKWFASYPRPDGGEHRFGIGVAMNVPTTDRLRAVVVGRKMDHRPIVFWLTVFEGEHKYISAFSVEEFKTMPERYESAAAETQTESFSPMLRDVITRLGDAQTEYLRQRRPSKPVM